MQGTYENKPFPFGIATVFILLVGFLFFFLEKPQFFTTENNRESFSLVTEPMTLTPNQIRILEVVSAHAYQNHGDEVNKAIRCLENNGSSKSFKTSFTDKQGNSIPSNVWLCFDGKTWFAVVTTTFKAVANDKVARLITAYKVATDIFPTIDDFINYIGLKWNAREISYLIEVGTIYLSPK